MRRPNYLAGVFALVWLAVIAAPLYAVMVTAARPSSEYLTSGPLAPPTDLTFDNFRLVLEGGFTQYVINTLIVTAGTVGIVLALSVPVAYSVVRGRGFLASSVFRMFLMGLAIPAQAVIIPVYLLINEMGLYDTYWAIILPTAAFSLPVSVMVLTTGMRDVPGELYEAMSLDGASTVRAFFLLAVPLSKGSIMTVTVFTALNSWNGFLFPLILTQSEDVRVVTLGLYNFLGQYSSNIPALLAAVLLSATPILALYLVARKAMVRGLAGVGGK
jgi:xylobiose transport system permease protein